MEAIDPIPILREIHDGDPGPHADLHDASVAHREAHGEGCGVHPSSLADATLWPLLTAVVGARRYLEVGCGLGYTAAVMAEAGGLGCRVDTIEAQDLHADLAEKEMAVRGLGDRVHVLRGQAREILPALQEPYDVVFVDADWSEYPAFLPDLARLTRRGGVLVTANLFPLFAEWAREAPHKDAVREYLTRLAADDRFRTHIDPAAHRGLSYRL